MIEVIFESGDFSTAQKIGLMMVQSIHDQLSGPRSGRWYPVPGNIFYDKMTTKENRADNYYVKFMGAKTREEIKGGAYQASAPGEAPAIRTGRLRQSFYVAVIPTGHGTYTAKVRSNVIYADDMEYGNEKIKARPFLRPAIEKIMPKIIELQKAMIYKIVRGEA